MGFFKEKSLLFPIPSPVLLLSFPFAQLLTRIEATNTDEGILFPFKQPFNIRIIFFSTWVLTFLTSSAQWTEILTELATWAVSF